MGPEFPILLVGQCNPPRNPFLRHGSCEFSEILLCQECVFLVRVHPSQTASPRLSRLWLAPQGSQESAEMSKYWLRPHASGRRKGKEKTWAHETSQRTKRRNAMPAGSGELDLTAMAAAGPARVTMVPAPGYAGAGSPAASAVTLGSPLSWLDNWVQERSLPRLVARLPRTREKMG